MGRFSLWEGKCLRQSRRIMSLSGLVLNDHEVILLQFIVKCTVDGGCSMDGLVLYHLQGFMVILDCDMFLPKI